jgi:outer membrane protein assembly factor BamE (lipoprotein component of BamABCDE complex)
MIAFFLPLNIMPAMKKRKVLICGLILFLHSICSAELVPIERWAVRDFWTQLESKMTEQQVAQLLSEPVDRETVKDFHIWYYTELLQRQGDRIISRPQTGILRFRLCPDGAYRLTDWKQPDWGTVTSYTEKQYQTVNSRFQRQQQLEQGNLERRALAAQRRAETEKRRTEQLALRQKQIEEAKQRRAEQTQQRQQQRKTRSPDRQAVPAQAKPKELTPAQLSSRFLIYGGIFIFTSAIIIAILQGFRYLGRK